MSKQLKHIPHLDGLRFISALMVVFHHYLSELDFDWNFPVGDYGVQIFFAISGFLITGILLRQKNAAEEIPRKTIIKNFFIKRALRLFPPYYILILVYIILQLGGLYIAHTGWIPYFLTYLPNIFFFVHGWQGTVSNHLWSLGIEEQFYLFWPFIILAIPKGKEYKLITVLIICGYVCKCLIWHSLNLNGDASSPNGKYDSFLLPLGQFDTLGVGALLACAVEYQMKMIDFIKKILPYVLPLSIIATVIISYDKPRNDPWLCFCLFFMAGSLVYKSYIGFTGWLKNFFDNDLVKYGGRISYGIYLYHKIIPSIVVEVFKLLKLSRPGPWFLLITSILLTFLAAHLSWIWIESRILKLKVKYDL